MTDEMKLLRAFIEASGYEIEEIKSNKVYMFTHDADGNPSCDPSLTTTLPAIDYKVTKKKQSSCGTGVVIPMGIYDELVSYLKAHGVDIETNTDDFGDIANIYEWALK